MPHWHPDEVRTVVVLSGIFYFASGESGMKANSNHIPRVRSTPSLQKLRTIHGRRTVGDRQVTGVGPSGKTFIPQ